MSPIKIWPGHKPRHEAKFVILAMGQSTNDPEGNQWQCSDLEANPQEWTVTALDGTKRTELVYIDGDKT